MEKLSGSNTLYYPGCVTRYALPDIQAGYEALLRRAGIDFIMLPGETLCCGSPVKRAGYLDEFEELKAKNLEVFARFSVRKVITNCPGCYHTLAHDYGLDAIHVSQALAELRPDEQSEDGTGTGDLTYHDPCHLGRWSGIYEEPRRLLAAAGWSVTELPDNREQSLCCGAGGGLKSNFPELADAIACQRLDMVNNGRLCTACPLCYAHFKQNADGVEVLEFSEALARGTDPEPAP
ncbi:MAG: (Fe-S)-binding protein [Actinobacteria bacterium]|nr:(Fe-S)-binding protein [Actinomycetota bacterium]